MMDSGEHMEVPRCYTTALADGTRVSKTDARIVACGELDELGAHVGAVCAALHKLMETAVPKQVEVLQQMRMRLYDVQRNLFAIGARVVGAQTRAEFDWTKATAVLTADITQWRQCGIRFGGFVLPTGSQTACSVHICRTVCRRAERSVVVLQDRDSVEYLNVLSKYLFHLALFINHVEGVDEIIL